MGRYARRMGGREVVSSRESYRRDLRIPEDLAEEVARTIGYDKIPATIPAAELGSRSFGSVASRETCSSIQRTQEMRWRPRACIR